MSPLVASISDQLNSLDAATYFFVSSGIFITVTAVLFFGLGLWLGLILWGRFKRRFRDAEDVIESFKGEVALLKRRIAEQSTRHAPGAGPSPLQAIAFKASVPKPLTPSIAEEFSAPEFPALPEDPTLGRPFTEGTESEWSPAQVKAKELPPARSFSVWTEPASKSSKAEGFVTASSVKTSMLPAKPLFALLEVFMVPRSRAYSVWTEKNWVPPVFKSAPTPAGQGFALWTLPNFEPRCRGPQLPSRAHSVWTSPDWTAPRQSHPPTPSARAFTLWTASDWKPLSRLPWSSSFSVWTESTWVPAPVKSRPQPLSAAWSVWTSPDFVPACRGALPPSRAHSVWTEEGWVPAPIPPQPRFVAKPFTLWAEPPCNPVAAPTVTATASQSAVVAAAAAAVASISGQPHASSDTGKGQGFMARALAAAKQALGLGALPLTPMPVLPTPADHAEPPPKPTARPASTTVARTPAPPSEGTPTHTPARTLEPAKVTVKPSASVPAVAVSIAATAAAVEALRQTGRVPVMTAGPLPPSKAFTVWAGAPSFDPASKITQHIALAALIESKITGEVPLPPAGPIVPAPMMPPVPAVPPAKVATSAPGPIEPMPSLLNLEPLVMPREPGKT